MKTFSTTSLYEVPRVSKPLCPSPPEAPRLEQWAVGSNNKAKWPLLAQISPRTQSIHQLSSPFSQLQQLYTPLSKLCCQEHLECRNFHLLYTLVHLLENKFLNWSPVEQGSFKDILLFSKDAIIKCFLLLGDLVDILKKRVLSTIERSSSRGRPFDHEEIIEPSCQLRHSLSTRRSLEQMLFKIFTYAKITPWFSLLLYILHMQINFLVVHIKLSWGEVLRRDERLAWGS